MSTLRIHNTDPARDLVVRVWHRSNAFMSDGDAPWLDADGAPTGERSHDHSTPPGATLALAVRDELAFTVLTDAAAEAQGIVGSVRRYFRTGSTVSGGSDAAPFSLTNEADPPLRVRVFASATFQLSPLREYSLGPGEAVDLSTGESGISVRVDRALESR